MGAGKHNLIEWSQHRFLHKGTLALIHGVDWHVANCNVFLELVIFGENVCVIASFGSRKGRQKHAL